jgi:outer membrane receptor protein involved in Fe transport
MRSRAAVFVFAAAMLGLCAIPAFAQLAPGRLTGLVTDTQGAIVPGVTVTATSPALIGVQTTVTQADGKFLFPALPSGTYKLTFELSGFRTASRDGIQLGTGQTLSVDSQLSLATLAETVMVTGAAPVVDVTSTRVGAVMKGAELIAVPTSSDTWGALSQAPGVRMQGFDVGGSHKSQQSGYESFGVQNQAKVVSDGVDHTEGVGGTGFYEDYYASEEVSVSSLGSDVEMNSPGAAIVTTIKSGGNTFKGLENVAYEPGSFVGSNADNAQMNGRGYTCPQNGLGTPQCDNPNLLFWEAHFDLGGPIMRDKLWFYAAYNQFEINKQVAGVAQSIATDLGKFNNQTFKGTYKLGSKNTIIGYYQRGQKEKPYRNLSSLNPPDSVLAQNSVSAMGKGEWQSVLTERAFLSVNVGDFHLAWPMVPAVDPAVKPPLQLQVNTSVAGAGWNAFTSERKKPQVKAQLTYFVPSKAGSHDLKFGFEDIYDWYTLGINGQSGPYRITINPAGVPNLIRFADVGVPSGYGTAWTTSANLDQHYSGYIQDRWAPNNRVTISAGLRFDYQRMGYTAANKVPVEGGVVVPAGGTTIFPSTSTIPAGTLFANTNVAPRVGVSYTLDPKGTTVLKAFYGRYYNNLADGFSSANPGGTSYVNYNFNDLNHNGLYDGVQELGTLINRIGTSAAPVDPNTKTPYTDEVSISVEKQFWDQSSIRGTYVRKMQKLFVPFYFNPIVTAWGTPSSITGNFTVPVTANYLGTNYNLIDVPNSLAGNTDTTYTNIADSDFTYDTIEVAFTKRAGRFFGQASANYQWRNELRSADIADFGANSPLNTDPIQVYPQQSVNPSAPNRQQTTMYGLQMSGHYSFAYDIGIGVNYRFQSGFNYSPIVPNGAVNLNACANECSFFVQNLSLLRSDAVNLLNFRIDKAVPLGGTRKATLMLDVYNLLNADPVTNFNLNVGPTYKTVIAVLDPRVFQMGFRFEF